MPHDKRRKMLILALKTLLSVVLVWWVLRHVQWADFTVVLGRTRYAWVAAGGLAFVGSVLAIAYRWWRLVRVQRIGLGLWESVRLTFLGSFFNYIILGTTGGDLVKAWYLSRHGAGKTTALVTVAVDRMLGLTGMTLLSAMMLLGLLAAQTWWGASRAYRPQLMVAAAVCGVVLCALLAGCAVMLSRRLRQWLHIEWVYQRLPLARQAADLGVALRLYRADLPAIGRAMGHTFVAQACFLGGIALMGVGVGLSVPWYQYFIYLPLIYIIAAVPITPAGMGVVEYSYVAFLSPWATDSEILALALLARVIPMLCSLPGLVVALTGPHAKHQIDAQDLPAGEPGARARG